MEKDITKNFENTEITKKVIKENVWKHLFVILCSLFSWPFLNSSLKGIDRSDFGNLLTIISILLVTVCFANFEFKYRSVNINSGKLRILSHIATFLFLFLTAVLLIMVCIGIGIIYPSMNFLILSLSFLLYFAIAIFDFWDILRNP